MNSSQRRGETWSNSRGRRISGPRIVGNTVKEEFHGGGGRQELGSRQGERTRSTRNRTRRGSDTFVGTVGTVVADGILILGPTIRGGQACGRGFARNCDRG